MQTKRKIKRYMLAVVLLVISAYITVFIKDTVDSMNPDKSLPTINVTVGYNPPYVVRAGYTWQYGLKTVRSPYVSAIDTALMTTDCPPNTNIAISCMVPYEYITVYQAEGLANDEFTKLYNLVTPAEEGIYVYKVEAKFEKGDILYYFAVQVKESNLLP